MKSLGLSFCLPAGLELITRCGNNFVLGSVRDNVAYGFCMLYGGEADIEVEPVPGGTVVRYAPRIEEPVTLAAGESLSSPETLVAYSDCGTDGMSRIFHDLFRELALPQTAHRRRPLVAGVAVAATRCSPTPPTMRLFPLWQRHAPRCA